MIHVLLTTAGVLLLALGAWLLGDARVLRERWDGDPDLVDEPAPASPQPVS